MRERTKPRPSHVNLQCSIAGASSELPAPLSQYPGAGQAGGSLEGGAQVDGAESL